eukprot:m.604324 g.604324  ORF g.604324 m.604324 type:complete len:64 (+) comp22459_c0_seq4:3359-3550(+)
MFAAASTVVTLLEENYISMNETSVMAPTGVPRHHSHKVETITPLASSVAAGTAGAAKKKQSTM